MARSKREIPHYYLSHPIDLTTAQQWLGGVNAGREPPERILLAALLFMKEDRLSYAGHLATLQIIGTLVLLPSVLLAPLLKEAGIFFCAISVLLSSGLMLRGHYRRVQLLGLSQRWTWLWLLLLQSSAAGLTLYFYSH